MTTPTATAAVTTASFNHPAINDARIFINSWRVLVAVFTTLPAAVLITTTFYNIKAKALVGSLPAIAPSDYYPAICLTVFSLLPFVIWAFSFALWPGGVDPFDEPDTVPKSKKTYCRILDASIMTAAVVCAGCVLKFGNNSLGAMLLGLCYLPLFFFRAVFRRLTGGQSYRWLWSTSSPAHSLYVALHVMRRHEQFLDSYGMPVLNKIILHEKRVPTPDEFQASTAEITEPTVPLDAKSLVTGAIPGLVFLLLLTLVLWVPGEFYFPPKPNIAAVSVPAPSIPTSTASAASNGDVAKLLIQEASKVSEEQRSAKSGFETVDVTRLLPPPAIQWWTFSVVPTPSGVGNDLTSYRAGDAAIKTPPGWRLHPNGTALVNPVNERNWVNIASISLEAHSAVEFGNFVLRKRGLDPVEFQTKQTGLGNASPTILEYRLRSGDLAYVCVFDYTHQYVALINLGPKEATDFPQIEAESLTIAQQFSAPTGNLVPQK